MTDSELIAAARAGDADAWGELYGRWLPWVWRYAYSLVGDRHVAEDVASEAMIAWVRRLNEADGEAAQLAGWLRTVVRNKSADHIRRLTRLRKAVAGVAAITPPSEERQPSQSLERDERRGQVRETLGGLSEQHQLVLEWKYAEGLSVRQIAQRLGTTEKSVEATLYRARREFRKRHETIQVPHGGCGKAGDAVNDEPAQQLTQQSATQQSATQYQATQHQRTNARNRAGDSSNEQGVRNNSAPARQSAPVVVADSNPLPPGGVSPAGESDERSDVST